MIDSRFPIRLLALDIDGTLVGEDLILRDRTRAAVAAALHRGVAVVLDSKGVAGLAVIFGAGSHSPDDSDATDARDSLIVSGGEIALANISSTVGHIGRPHGGHGVHEQHPIRLENAAQFVVAVFGGLKQIAIH